MSGLKEIQQILIKAYFDSKVIFEKLPKDGSEMTDEEDSIQIMYSELDSWYATLSDYSREFNILFEK